MIFLQSLKSIVGALQSRQRLRLLVHVLSYIWQNGTCNSLKDLPGLAASRDDGASAGRGASLCSNFLPDASATSLFPMTYILSGVVWLRRLNQIGD